METMTVIAADGATVRGPARLRLTREQWMRRAAVLGPVPKKLGPVDLDGGQILQFKRGETFGYEAPEWRLNPAVFGFASSEVAHENDAPSGKGASA